MTDIADAFVAQFLELIDQLLRGELDVPTFKARFDGSYFGQHPNPPLSAEQDGFLSDVSEMVYWASNVPFPTDEEISDGVLPRRELLARLASRRASYQP